LPGLNHLEIATADVGTLGKLLLREIGQISETIDVLAKFDTRGFTHLLTMQRTTRTESEAYYALRLTSEVSQSNKGCAIVFTETRDSACREVSKRGQNRLEWGNMKTWIVCLLLVSIGSAHSQIPDDLQKKADQGKAYAQEMIGSMYEMGEGVPQDYAQAMEWYKKAADQGDAGAQNFLGGMYQKGEGVPKDSAQALQWYKKSADRGLDIAQESIGEMYETGEGVPQNYAQALEWYRKAGDQGNPVAQHKLGDMYLKGEGVERDPAQALQWYHKVADKGNAYAQFKIGHMYETGDGVPQDYAQALEWYRKAAQEGGTYLTAGGISDAENALGDMFFSGKGVTQDYGRAREWYKKAAWEGNTDAQDAIGKIYLLGKGVPQDSDQSMQWYKNTADQGDAAAQDIMGEMYLLGHGVPQDYAQAMEWYKKAADQGNADAQDSIGQMYLLGCGVPKDNTMAMEWFKKAADQGDADALFRIGLMYRYGAGVPKDSNQATKYQKMAADQENAKIKNQIATMTANAPAPVAPLTPSIGQKISITLADGTVKAGKLVRIDPDGITILTDDGGGKVLFDSMGDTDKAMFGYSPTQVPIIPATKAAPSNISPPVQPDIASGGATSSSKANLGDTEENCIKQFGQPTMLVADDGRAKVEVFTKDELTLRFTFLDGKAVEINYQRPGKGPTGQSELSEEVVSELLAKNANGGVWVIQDKTAVNPVWSRDGAWATSNATVDGDYFDVRAIPLADEADKIMATADAKKATSGL
jgi:TPR repeat protein